MAACGARGGGEGSKSDRKAMHEAEAITSQMKEGNKKLDKLTDAVVALTPFACWEGGFRCDGREWAPSSRWPLAASAKTGKKMMQSTRENKVKEDEEQRRRRRSYN